MSATPSPPDRSRKRRLRKQKRGNHAKLPTVQETSAGGFVIRHVANTVHVALVGRIDRRGRLEWILPKGHVEAGETTEQTAVREVQEETGIDAEVISKVGEIDYWFVADNQRIHKTVHHFLLQATGGTLNTHDLEVSEAAWVPFELLPNRLRYASERQLARRALTMLPEVSPREDRI